VFEANGRVLGEYLWGIITGPFSDTDGISAWR